YAYQTDINSTAAGSQSITTYSVVLNGSTDSDMKTYLSLMAKYGGGKALLADDYTALYNAFLQILNEVQSVNSVFASSSLPVNGFWKNTASMNNSPGVGFDSPDGEWVEKGGAAQQTRIANLVDNYVTAPSTPRKLYTYCVAGTGCVGDLTSVTNSFSTAN